MSYLGKVKKSLEFIESNLKEELGLLNVARVVAFSPYHFHYVFGATVGESFKDYIRKRRLTEAAHELRKSERRIIEIALDYQFESQEAFSRAFKKMFRVNPGAYRKIDKSLKLYEKKKLTLKELEHRMKGIKLKQRNVKVGGFSVIGLEYLGSNDHKGVIGKLWDEFFGRRIEIPGQVESQCDYGYCYATPEMAQAEQMRYIAGVKVKSLRNIPQGMVGVRIPAQNYAVFTHRGPVAKIGVSYDYIYKAWFPKSGTEPAQGPDFELYDERFKYDAEDSELDLYVPVK